jgi:hypothetical protein
MLTMEAELRALRDELTSRPAAKAAKAASTSQQSKRMSDDKNGAEISTEQPIKRVRLTQSSLDDLTKNVGKKNIEKLNIHGNILDKLGDDDNDSAKENKTEISATK